MPSRAPLTDEEMQALRDRMERYEAAKSTRTPPPAPSQTFGMRTHSSRNVGRRPRYDPEAAASERYHHNLELMDLRKKVEADNEERAVKQREKVQAAKDRNDGNHPAGGYPQPILSIISRDSNDPATRRAYWKERGIDSPGLSPEERAKVQGPTAKVQLPVGDRPISSMYSVTPNQYQAAYHIPFSGSDPDSMRRLLALQNGTASVIGSERGVIDQRKTDKDNAAKYANMKPAVGDHSREVKEPGEPGSDYSSRAFIENLIPDGTYDEANRQNGYDMAIKQAGGVPPQGQIDAMDRQRAMELERIRQGRIFDLNSESISDRYGIPPVQTMSQMMDPDSPMSTGPGRKGVVPRKR